MLSSLPGSFYDRITDAVFWLKDSVARVARVRNADVRLRIAYEFGHLTLKCDVPARLHSEPDKAYEHVRDLWARWLTDNPDLATLPEALDTPNATKDLSNADFAARMRTLRENRHRDLDTQEAAKADPEAVVIWDDTFGGAQR